MARRTRGEGSVFQRADGRWVAILDLGGPQEARRRKTFTSRDPGPAGRRAVARKLAKAKAELAQSALILSAPTVEQWLRYWRDDVAAHSVRASTMRGYDTYIEQHIVPRIGKHRLDRLEPAHVRALYADMRRPCPTPDEAGKCPHRPSHGRAEASIRQCHAILKRALRVAVQEGKAARNAADILGAPKTTRNPRTPLTVHQARQVLAAAAGDPMESRWYAALWLGLRQGECLGLGWYAVDLDRGAVLVERALQRVKGRGLVLVEPKSRASVRWAPLPPTVAAHLRVHLARELAAGRGRPDDYVWGGDGRPIDPAKDYKAWGRLLAKAGVPRVALHAARNTAGSLLMAAGVPDKVAAEILGHATVQVTQAHYQAGDLEQRQRAMLALEAYAQPADATPRQADPSHVIEQV